MDVVLGIVVILVLSYLVFTLLGWMKPRRPPWWPDRHEDDDDLAAESDLPQSAPAAEQLELQARELAAKLLDEQEYVDLPTLEADARAGAMAARLADERFPFEQLERLSVERSNFFLAALALQAIAQRSDVPQKWTTRAIGQLRRCPNNLEPFVYAALLERASDPVIGPALVNLDEGITWDFLATFIEQRRARGEELTLETFSRNLPARFTELVADFASQYQVQLGEDFGALAEEWKRTVVDVEFLSGFAIIWEPPYDEPPMLDVARRGELAELVAAALAATPRRSVLLVGDPGVGKRTAVRAALEQLPRGLVVFEATASQFNAGAIYVGELEDRVRQLAEKLERADAVWVCPAFEEMVYAGQHSRSPKGLLDALSPHLHTGELTMVGLVSPSALERILADRPQISALFEIIRVRPMSEQPAVEVAREVLARREPPLEASGQTLQETYELAQQFLPHLSAPGNMVRLLGAAAAELAESGRTRLEGSDVLGALAAASGLPLALLDPATPLELEELHDFFAARVLGQEEAVEAVTERILIAKAGLTDPTRPLAVLLFIGPTGTGKTELAKALAEFMFGSPSRMIRLDMSEYQTPDALDRLLSDPSVERRGAALISSVRNDPFAVVLLDEFEKAAEPVWDLFLQVFDDGRLSDQRGRVADFRRCMIILTSNIGSALAHKAGVGFGTEHGRFRSELIDEELKRSFRPEFLNRIDRVVVFQPFTRVQMRALLDKELSEVLLRRGLRGRPWAVELDESTYEFLIERGFSPQMGARPLKRSVERHLLAPIARAIGAQQVPEGEQFLFASAHGEHVDVRFVDPDAPGEERDADREPEAALDLRAIALRGHGDERTTRFLLEEMTRVEAALIGPLGQRKEQRLAQMQDHGFWEDEGRHGVLAEIEYLDRLDNAAETARKLAGRLERQQGRNGAGGAGELTRMLALRLHVLTAAVTGVEAGAPAELFLRLHATVDADRELAERCARELVAMYEAWAAARGMRFSRLDEAEHVYHVSGLGAWTILAPEEGIHLFEFPSSPEGRPERVSIVCELAACPPEVGPEPQRLVAASRTAFDGSAVAAVTRRYRAGSAPLVRDSARDYRTGRLEQVLAGDFDLF